MKKFRRLIRRMPGIIPFLILLIIRLLFSALPTLFETLYFNSFFPLLRSFQSWLYPIWLVPGYFILIVLVPGLILFYFLKRNSFKHFLNRVLNLFFWIAAVFLLCFGMQYADPGIAVRLNFEEAPESVDFTALYYKTMEDALEKRMNIEGLNDSTDITQLDYSLNFDSIHDFVKSILLPAGYRASEMDQRVREIPFFALRKLSISGIYNPFTGESNVEGSLPVLIKSFVSAHELAHASGITGEGEANFVAWLSLAHSGDPYLEYAAAYFIWRQVAKSLNTKLDGDVLEKLALTIPESLNRDRWAIYRALNQEQAWYPELSSRVNDSYLKIQGVQSGVDDYDKFLELYLRFQRRLNPQ